jgi:hypothetical protein
MEIIMDERGHCLQHSGIAKCQQALLDKIDEREKLVDARLEIVVEKVRTIERLMEERKGAQSEALILASTNMDKKLVEMNGIKAEVLQQTKDAAEGRGQHKWADAIIYVLTSSIVSGIVAYLVSRGG